MLSYILCSSFSDHCHVQERPERSQIYRPEADFKACTLNALVNPHTDPQGEGRGLIMERLSTASAPSLADQSTKETVCRPGTTLRSQAKNKNKKFKQRHQ